ncbi:hypothetical protein EON80_29310 [bacterium]|nr:MAG: hypothetical protein EON80_29310 [bacterium]
MVGPEVYFDLLSNFREKGCRYFLGGGQAVNFWARYYRSTIQEDLGLDPYDPFTSKDCDIWVDYGTFKFFETEPGNLRKSQSPADGQLAIYTMPGEAQLRVDLLTAVYGIPTYEIERVVKRVQIISGIAVIDPIYLLKAKCHNLAGLPQGNRQDRKHVGMMSRIVPAYLTTVFQAMHSGEITDRQTINELEFLLDLGNSDGVVARTLGTLGLQCRDLVPWEKIENSPSEKMRHFVASLSQTRS